MKRLKSAASRRPTFSAIRRSAACASIFLALLLALAGCGRVENQETGTGSSSTLSNNRDLPDAVPDNSFSITTDEYGLQTPNFYYSTDNPDYWSIQADIADDIYDRNFACVIRIDIRKSDGVLPDLDRTFSIEPGAGHAIFPGSFFVFNGHPSVSKKVESGTISFIPGPGSGEISGEYDLIIVDYDSKIRPAPDYRVTGSFRFVMGTYGPAEPRPSEIYPVRGKEAYDASCSTCHKLGTYDEVGESASDLSLRGGELSMIYPGTVAEHQSILLDDQTTQTLRIFLNAF